MSLITYLTTIRFAEGAVAELGQDLADLGVDRALVVTDRGLVANGVVERALAGVARERIAAVFDATPTNPTEAAVAAALAVYRESGATGLVAIGGGSPIDLAKAVALLATHGGALADYALILGGLARITARVAPVIAVPTTSGTGSEVGRASLVTLADGRKLGLVSPHLIPKRAVCDPELTYGLPPGLTAATGLDAVSHCVETFWSPRYNPPADAIALDGLSRAMEALPRAVANGADKGARRDMMMAALQGGLCFQKGLGAIHAISHPLGGLEDLALHHGTLNAVMLPHVARFNLGAAPDKDRLLAAACGLSAHADLAGYFAEFVADLGLPTSLSAMGVPRQVLPSIAAAALKDHSAPTNPRPLDEASVTALIEAAF